MLYIIFTNEAAATSATILLVKKVSAPNVECQVIRQEAATLRADTFLIICIQGTTQRRVAYRERGGGDEIISEPDTWNMTL